MIVLDSLHLILFALLRQRVDHIRLGRIHPPGVNALGEKSLVRILPVQIRGGWIVDIEVLESSPAHGRKQISVLVHLLVNLRRRPQPGPDRNHQVEVLLVQLVDHFLGAGILCFIEDHPTPVIVIAPVIPVLHDVINRNMALAILPRNAQQFVARGVMLLALPVAVGPLAVHGRLAGELPVSRNFLIDCGAVEKVVIDVIANL